MPSQATPLPIVPAAQPANPARGASTSQAAEGFEAMVKDAKRDRQDANEVAAAIPAATEDGARDSDGDSFVATLPVQAVSRPASGSVLDALSAAQIQSITGQATAPGATDSDQGAAILTQVQAKADPVAGKTDANAVTSSALTGANPEPASNSVVDVEPLSPDQNLVSERTPAESDASSQTSLMSAREARIAEALQRLNLAREEASTPSETRPGAEVKPNPEAPDAKSGVARVDPALDGKPAQATIDAKTAEPAPRDIDLSARAETVTSDGEVGDTDMLAALKDGRPASERAPGELIRTDMRAARNGAEAGVAKADGKSAAADVKASSTSAASHELKAAPQAVAAAQAPATQTTTIAPLEVLLAQTAMGPRSEPALGDAPLDPLLSKSDAAFDPAAARVESRAEVRTASTLQYAQGPRLTPQSAQTMAAQIAQRFNEGTRVFDIRMDPPELGRVEVRLEVGKDNSVRAILAAERTETLAELQRSARELERALTEAGLDVGEDALSFSLTDDSEFFEDAQADTGSETPVFVNDDAGLDALSAPLAPLSTYGFLLTRAEGLDVSV